MANTKVEIKVAVKPEVEAVYLVGSATSLGGWNPKKAVALEYCEACGKYVVSKLLPVGETVEFKVLAGKSWEFVEKGIQGEELENHTIVPTKGLSVEVEVVNFSD